MPPVIMLRAELSRLINIPCVLCRPLTQVQPLLLVLVSRLTRRLPQPLILKFRAAREILAPCPLIVTRPRSLKLSTLMPKLLLAVSRTWPTFPGTKVRRVTRHVSLTFDVLVAELLVANRLTVA